MGPWSPAPTPRASGQAPRTRRVLRHSAQRPTSAHRPPTCPEIRSEECRRDPEPDPGQADRRGAVRGAQAQHRRGLRAHRQQIQVPGFRKGKVPPRIIDQRVGRGAVLEHAVNEALPQFYGAGRRREQAAPARASPRPTSPSGRPRTSPATCKFTVEVDVRPEIDAARLLDASPSRSTRWPSTPTRSTRSWITALQQRFGTLDRASSAPPRPATSSPSTSSRRSSGEEIDTGQRHLLRGRLGQHDRGHRRGARSA